MRSILDELCANTDRAARAGATSRPASGAPVIVSENHNADSINWVAGLSDPGEMIGCGRYQELRRLAGESDDAYFVRLSVLLLTIPEADRVKIETAMRAAALRRAGLDQSTGRIAVMVAGKAPWHRLGVNVREAVSSEHAITLSGLDWKTVKAAMQYFDPVANAWKVDKSTFSLTRSDNGRKLGTVGSRYQPLQNREAFAFLDTVLNEFGAKYETAGALFGGERVWMLAKLPSGFRLHGRDEMEAFALFTNPHNGEGCAEVFPTTHRVVCANTFRAAMGEDSKRALKIRHTGDLKAKISDARQALGIAVKSIHDFQEHAEVLINTKCDAVPYFNGLLDDICSLTDLQAKKGPEALLAEMVLKDDMARKWDAAEKAAAAAKLEKEIEFRKELLNDLCERYDSERNGVNGMRGTAWAGFNSVTESVDHGPLAGNYRGEDKESRRFESLLTGRGDEIKQLAYQSAVALAN
jgi:phage/plasmid-like protein (TIGR03299 family)